MKFSLAEKIVSIVGIVSLVAILVTAVMVDRMSDVVNDRPELSGQSFEINGTITERHVGESPESWKARILEAMQTARDVRESE